VSESDPVAAPGQDAEILWGALQIRVSRLRERAPGADAMSESSSIEWTDATWNPVRGCVKVSPGCAHCYAETFAERWRGVKGHPYEQGFDLRLVPEKLAEPLSWKKPRRVFVNSMSDLFQDGVPDAFIDRVFAVMALTPEHTYQLLTKRAERMRDYMRDPARHHGVAALLPANGRAYPRWPNEWPLANVWLGVSAENQPALDARLPLLLQTPAAQWFLSCEPLLGGLDIAKHRPGANRLWVIVGGESGPRARPCQTWWIRNIVRQCQQADVPVFVKQLGTNIIDRNDAGFEGDTARSWPMDTNYRENLSGFRDDYQGAAVRILLKKKGGDMDEWPADLRVREFPADRRSPKRAKASNSC
jgi:protein gp37